MPKYTYKCPRCEDTFEVTLPMSADPKKLLNYPGHKNMCLGLFKRIITPGASFKGFKVFAGDWFKKTYGFDIGEKETTKAELQKDCRRAEEKHKREM